MPLLTGTCNHRLGLSVSLLGGTVLPLWRGLGEFTPQGFAGALKIGRAVSKRAVGL